MSTKPKLIYFSSRGRAELIRILLAEVGVDYEDIKVGGYNPSSQPEGFIKIKEQGLLDFGALPLWQEENLNLVQSQTILRYLSRKYGLYGANNLEAAQIDCLFDGIQDYMTVHMKLRFADSVAKPALKKQWIEVDIPKWFTLFENYLKKKIMEVKVLLLEIRYLLLIWLCGTFLNIFLIIHL